MQQNGNQEKTVQDVYEAVTVLTAKVQEDNADLKARLQLIHNATVQAQVEELQEELKIAKLPLPFDSPQEAEAFLTGLADSGSVLEEDASPFQRLAGVRFHQRLPLFLFGSPPPLPLTTWSCCCCSEDESGEVE